MTKRNNPKAQAKALKRRKERSTKKHDRSSARALVSKQFDRARVAALVARGNAINTPDLTRQDVIDMVNFTIEATVGVSSLIETGEILEREGKFSLTEEQRKLTDEFDKEVILFNENAEVIMTVLSEDGKLEDVPPELLMDSGFRSDRLVAQMSKDIIEIYKPHSAMFDTYHKEHYPGMVYRDIMFRLALTRVQRLQPKYATPAIVEAEEVTGDEAAEAHSILNDKEVE